MDDLDTAIVLIPLLAVLAPVAARAMGAWIRVPVVVFELVLGIVIGPSVLGWTGPSEFVGLLSEFGLAMLFFVAGTEIEFAVLRGRTGRRAIGGWFVSFALGVALGLLIAPGLGAIVVGIALASTALGALLPILRDAGELRTPFGRAVSALGAVGEFGPLIAISILLGATGLPIIVADTGIGVDQNLISSGLASVLVGAGMLSLLIFPLVGMSLRGDPVSRVELSGEAVR